MSCLIIVAAVKKGTYKIVVGRSAKLEGPYAGQEGVAMNLGGGSIVLEGDADWNGVGHNAVVNFDGTDYLIFHGYDANDKGKSKLRIEKLTWAEGWPQVERPSSN